MSGAGKPKKKRIRANEEENSNSNSNSNYNSNANSKRKSKKSRIKISATTNENTSNSSQLFGVPRSAPAIANKSPLIQAATIKLLVDTFGADVNRNKASQKTTLFSITPTSLVAPELRGKTLFVKPSYGDFLMTRKEAEITWALSNQPSHYVSELLAYEFYPAAKVGLLLFNIPPGKSLRQFGREQHQNRKCRPRQLEKIIDDLVTGLQYIHSRGILHRDIKPDNIFIPDDPSKPAYFLDFGESSHIGQLNSVNARLRGTKQYAKPNKLVAALSYSYNQSDDIYALKKTIEQLVSNCPSEIRERLMFHLMSRLGEAGGGGGGGAAALPEEVPGEIVPNVFRPPQFGISVFPQAFEEVQLPAAAAVAAGPNFVSRAPPTQFVAKKWDPSILLGLEEIPKEKTNNSSNSEAEGGRRQIRRRKTHRRIR